MTDFILGPGIAAAIAENNDEARSDEQYVIMREGDRVSVCYARDALYYWYESENTVKRCPF